jgi:hypothetical protein
MEIAAILNKLNRKNVVSTFWLFVKKNDQIFKIYWPKDILPESFRSERLRLNNVYIHPEVFVSEKFGHSRAGCAWFSKAPVSRPDWPG